MVSLKRIAVVIANWNGTDLSVNCLRSVVESGYQPRIVIIVDDHSDEDPSEALRRAAPEVQVVRRARNGGYAAACNAGAERALNQGAEYLLFLNNDATIDPTTLPALLNAAGRHPQAILGPKIVYAHQPNRIWSAGGWLRPASVTNGHFGLGQPAHLYTRDRAVDWTSGCAIFVSAATYRRLGPIDEGYFLYHEDTDWCLRAKRYGIETWFVARATVRHGVTKTVRALPSEQIEYYKIRNTYRLFYRHSPWWARPALTLRLGRLAGMLIFERGLPVGWRKVDYQAGRHAVLDILRGRSGACLM